MTGPIRITRLTATARANWAPLLLLPFAGCCVALALIRAGIPDGNDLFFHLQSWVDAARHFRAGDLHPHFNYLAAYHAGEPRFVFYPPLSWTLGGLLYLVSSAHVVLLFVTIAVTAAAVAMYVLAREYAPQRVAVLCAVFYAVNPYLLYNAVERAAMGELLAATAMPLLMWGALRRRPSVPGIAIPLALLWLSNVPCAVEGTYLLAFLLLMRLFSFLRFYRKRPANSEGPVVRSFVLTAVAGFALGLGLSAFYLLPAFFERKYVQVWHVLFRASDHFLFRQSKPEHHDMVSFIAVGLLALTFVLLLLAWQANSNRAEQDGNERRGTLTAYPGADLVKLLFAITVLIGLALTPVSTLLWKLPTLDFINFPWRLLTILSVVTALALALALRQWKLANRYALVVAPLVALLLAFACVYQFRKGLVRPKWDATLIQLLETGHGATQLQENTPVGASLTAIHINSPGYWLSMDPGAYAPGTFPSPISPNANPVYNVRVLPPEHLLSTPAPHHLQLDLAQPETLILNLRDYPNWRIMRNGSKPLAHVPRVDGLVAVQLPAGASSIDVRWQRSWDAVLGDVLTLFSLAAVLWLWLAGYRNKVPSLPE